MDVFDGAFRIVPVTDDVQVRFVGKEHAADIIGFLGQAHGIHFAAGAGYVRFNAAAAGGVDKDPVGAAAVGARGDFLVLVDLVDGVFFRG